MTENDEWDALTFYKDGDQMIVEGRVSGETVYYAQSEAVASAPVIRAAFRSWGMRAYPEVAERIRDEAPEDDVGAFQ